MPSTAAPPRSLLFVCTGNICRSPTAEGVMRQRLAQAGLADAVRVDSAGTHGYHVGDAPDPRAIRAAAARGVDIAGLRARKVAAADFERFDLILALDRGHYDALHRQAPAQARHKVRLLLDFAPAHTAPGGDVPDPYYDDLAAFEHVLDLVEAAADGLLDAVRGSADRT